MLPCPASFVVKAAYPAWRGLLLGSFDHRSPCHPDGEEKKTKAAKAVGISRQAPETAQGAETVTQASAVITFDAQFLADVAVSCVRSLNPVVFSSQGPFQNTARNTRGG